MRTMFDAVNPDNIPASAEMVAGYVNGPRSQWPLAAWAEWPDAALVRIDVVGDAWQLASVADVETGDILPWQVRNWIYQRNLHYNDATVYCNISTLAQVKTACAGLHYKIWLADWTGAPHQRPDLDGDGATIVAVQYVANLSPGYDISAVYYDTWHPQPSRALPLMPGPWDETHLTHLAHLREDRQLSTEQTIELSRWMEYATALEKFPARDDHESHVLRYLRTLGMLR